MMLKCLMFIVVFATSVYSANERNPYGPHLGAYLRSQAKARQESGEVVNNVPFNITEAPYQLSLHFFNDHFCSGVIISPTIGLTAGHCMYGFVELVHLHYILAGHESLNEGYEADALIQMETAIVHDDYNYNDLGNDICLFTVVSPFHWSDRIQPINLPSSFQETVEGTEALVTGWRILQNESFFSQSDQLHGINVYTMDLQSCNESYTGRITDDMLCVDLDESGRDACTGDSGSPLVFDDPEDDEEPTLIGIVSWTEYCGFYNDPPIYARVAYFRDWIQEFLDLSSETSSSEA